MQANLLLLLGNKQDTQEPKIFIFKADCIHFFVKFLKKYIFTDKIVTYITKNPISYTDITCIWGLCKNPKINMAILIHTVLGMFEKEIADDFFYDHIDPLDLFSY